MKGQSLEASLKQNDMNMAVLEGNIRHELEVERMVRIPIKPALHMRHVWHATIATLYMDMNTAKMKTRTDREALKIIQTLRDKLKAGANFGDLAARYSDYPAEQQNHGDLGILYDGVRYSADLFPPTRGLKEGEWSTQTFKSPAGYELLYVSSTAESHPASENGLYKQAEEQYRQQQLDDAARLILKSLRAQAKVALYDKQIVSETADIPELRHVAPGTAPPGIVATVDGQAITRDRLEARTLTVAGPGMLRHMIESKIIDEAAAARNITVTPPEIEAKKEILLMRMGGQPLDVALKAQHMTMEQLESNFRDEIKVEKIAGAPVKPATHMRHVFHIAIAAQDAGPLAGNAAPVLPGAPKPPTRAEALARLAMIRSRLEGGASFAEMAKEYSDDMFSKNNGGDMGIMHDGTNVNLDIVKVALGLKKGEYSAPFKSFFGYDMVYIASTAEDHPQGEDDLYALTEAEYQESQRTAPTDKVLAALGENAHVEIYFSP
jgi:parvulin-like peptidyl-prolyl isomerase